MFELEAYTVRYSILIHAVLYVCCDYKVNREQNMKK